VFIAFQMCLCYQIKCIYKDLFTSVHLKKPREEPGLEGWPVLFWLCQVEIITVRGQIVQTFIDDQKGQIIIFIVVVEGATGQIKIKCIYIALLTSADISKCCTETSNSKQCRCRSMVARENSLNTVNRSGFQSHRQNC
jgi:hypothetical protein